MRNDSFPLPTMSSLLSLYGRKKRCRFLKFSAPMNSRKHANLKFMPSFRVLTRQGRLLFSFSSFQRFHLERFCCRDIRIKGNRKHVDDARLNSLFIRTNFIWLLLPSLTWVTQNEMEIGIRAGWTFFHHQLTNDNKYAVFLFSEATVLNCLI